MVYLVTSGDGWDGDWLEIHGVFSTRERAEDFVTLNPHRLEIEELALDDPKYLERFQEQNPPLPVRGPQFAFHARLAMRHRPT